MAGMSASIYRKPLTIGLLLSVVAMGFEGMAVTTAMPVAARELGSESFVAWTYTAFVIAQTFAIVLAGQLVDRKGPLGSFIGGISLFATGVVLAATAPVIAQLLVARAVQGFGTGLLNLATMVVVARGYSEAERPHVMTMFSTGWVLPAIVGPAFAAWLATHLSWHWVFWCVLPLLAIGVAFVVRPLLEIVGRTEPTGEPFDKRVIALAGVVALAAAVLQAAGQWFTPFTAAGAVVALVAIALSMPRLMPPGFRWWGTGLSGVVLARGLVIGSFFGTQAFLALLLTHARGLDLVLAGVVITLSSLGWMVGSWLQSRHWIPLSRDALITTGTVVVATGMAIIALAAWVPAIPVPVIAVGFAVAGVGMGLATASSSLALMQLSEPAELGHNTSSLQVAEALGGALAGGLGGTLFVLTGASDRPLTYGPIFTAMVLFALGATVASRRVGHLANWAHRDSTPS